MEGIYLFFYFIFGFTLLLSIVKVISWIFKFLEWIGTHFSAFFDSIERDRINKREQNRQSLNLNSTSTLKNVNNSQYPQYFENI